MPLCEPWSWGLALSSEELPASTLMARLRAAPVPVIGRIEEDRVVLDLRTVAFDEEADLIQAIGSA